MNIPTVTRHIEMILSPDSTDLTEDSQNMYNKLYRHVENPKGNRREGKGVSLIIILPSNQSGLGTSGGLCERSVPANRYKNFELRCVELRTTQEQLCLNSDSTDEQPRVICTDDPSTDHSTGTKIVPQ